MITGLLDRYYETMRRAPPPGRAEAVRLLVSAWRRPGLPRSALDELEAAIGAALDDPSPAVRLALARELAAEARAPRHVVLALSQDSPAIAAEILAETPALIDSELVDAVALSPAAVQCAIALRPRLSAALSAAIATVADRQACLLMLSNDGATLVKSAFAALLQRFGADAEMQDAVFRRPETPVGVRHELVERSILAQCGPASGGRLGEMEAQKLRATQDRATIALAADAPSDELPDLVGRLMSGGRLTTALLLRAAIAGRLGLLEHGLARLSGSSAGRVRAMMQEERGPGFRALCLRAGLPERACAALAAALEVSREDGPPADAAPSRRHVERVLDRYERDGANEMDDVLALIRRLSAEAGRTGGPEPLRRGRQDPRLRANYVGAQRGFRSPAAPSTVRTVAASPPTIRV